MNYSNFSFLDMKKELRKLKHLKQEISGKIMYLIQKKYVIIKNIADLEDLINSKQNGSW